ncbi:MAG: DUF2804 domain-containing protein [Spirochaetaceae bacterium]|nr:DUF2804 domain-containing protein [Spirochaetaceae bacterium]
MPGLIQRIPKTGVVSLYSRKIDSPPEEIIVNGVPVFGNFNGPFRRLDIRGIKRPFGDMPIPVFLTDMRIIGYSTFIFLTGDYIGLIETCDAPLFGFSEITFWNRSSGKKLAYRRAVGPFRAKLPMDMNNVRYIFRSKNRKIRLLWNSEKVSALFSVRGDESRPDAEASFSLDITDPRSGQMASVLPLNIRRRCLASWQVTAPLEGCLTIGEKTASAENGIGFFDVRKFYHLFRTKFSRVMGIGSIDGRQVMFRLFSRISSDEYRYNENVLFVDGKTWPLPPVKITRPYGINGTWIIQDTESMVDLAFTPISDNKRKMSIFLLRTEYHTIYGTFDGFLLTGKGEKIQLRSFSGIGKKLMLRL